MQIAEISFRNGISEMVRILPGRVLTPFGVSPFISLQRVKSSKLIG